MRKRKGMAVIAAIVMTAVMSLGSSLAATSVGISDGAAAATVNQTVVGFAGHEWWVIGDAKGGVYSKDKSVTLLAKSGGFGNTEFRKRSDTEQEGYNQFYTHWYEGTFTYYPGEYKDSTLQRKMVEIASNLPAKERGKINKRTLSEGTDGIEGGNVADQQLWPLSRYEHEDIGKGMDHVRKYDKDYWLRSLSLDKLNYASFAPAEGHTDIFSDNVYFNMAARPALNLNVSSVILTSNAGQTGKAAATPGGGLVSVTTPVTTGDSNKIKYTFKDSTLKLGNVYVSKIENNTVTVKYTGATGGKNLSLIVKNSKGAVTHYGKLAENIKAEGEESFTLPDGFDSSKNKVEVFVEEIGKDDNHSDFASTPKALNINTVTVNGGTGGGHYLKDAVVTLKADPAAAGERFKGWEISPEVTPIQDTSFTDETITFTMPDEAVTATAVYEYNLTVTGGTGSNYYTEDEEVTITANPAAAGKRFKGWEISPAIEPTKGSLTSEEIGFNMPKQAVTATALYENVYTVTVNSGSISGGIGEYAEGEEVTLTADPAPEGKYFKGWNISPEVTLTEGTNTSSIIKFDMPAHAVTATAEYEDLIVYSVKDGGNTGWTQGDEGGLIITSVGEHRKFTGVTVDGNTVDRQHYTVESGSTIVTLKSSYLSTLSVGEHVMRIHFTDGYTETRFSIQAQQTDNPNPPTTDPSEPTPPVNPPIQPGEPNPPVQGGTTTATTVATVGTSPKTGDSNMIWIMVSVMLGAGVGFMVINVMKRNTGNIK